MHLLDSAEAFAHTPNAPAWTQSDFTEFVNAALKNYNSVLALARSPLANSALVSPLLVLDDVSPTAEERGRAMRLVLAWAVNRLAPEPMQYPLGAERPFDDPTWSDSRWWRYNILRHRYLEPLHPDDFVESGRFTETLVSLTGIPSTDTFFDERNRAIREVAQWLQDQLESGRANAELQQLALGEAHQVLQKQQAALDLLGVAATFDAVFPRSLLNKMAAIENYQRIEHVLDYLIRYRFLLTEDTGSSLWLAPVLRRFIYARQPPALVKRRHQRAADYYMAQAEPLPAIRHLQQAEQWSTAAAMLLEAAPELINELQAAEVRLLLQRFSAAKLEATQWRDVQILLSDLLMIHGAHEEALAACRSALRVAHSADYQARIYRRMGKLFEFHNQLHALNYYQQALTRFEIDNPERIDLLKDRAWIYILRKEWRAAEQDLLLALGQTPTITMQQRADILDALSYLCGENRRYGEAIQYAQDALALREELGDMVRVAKSFGNLGLLYTNMGEYAQAIAAHEDALRAHRQLDNRPQVAVALCNLGMAHHFEGRLQTAIGHYQESLETCRAIGLPLAELRVHSNLAEAYAQLEQPKLAKQHWEVGYNLALQSGSEDQIDYFNTLRNQFAIFQSIAVDVIGEDVAAPAAEPLRPTLDQDELEIVQLAKAEPRLTPKLIMDLANVSRATATRRLTSLTEKGYLQVHGKGRGTYYTLAEDAETRTQLAPGSPAPSPQFASDASLALLHEEIYAVLRKHRQQLFQRYNVAAIGLAAPPEISLPHSQLVVRFDARPNLESYLALKQHLSDLLHVKVDLLPESQLNAQSAAPIQQPGEIAWVWS
ncbi:MAG: tetratricopeptide repeat protein [Caldilineaceae bacterium]